MAASGPRKKTEQEKKNDEELKELWKTTERLKTPEAPDYQVEFNAASFHNLDDFACPVLFTVWYLYSVDLFANTSILLIPALKINLNFLSACWQKGPLDSKNVVRDEAVKFLFACLEDIELERLAKAPLDSITSRSEDYTFIWDLHYLTFDSWITCILFLFSANFKKKMLYELS